MRRAFVAQDRFDWSAPGIEGEAALRARHKAYFDIIRPKRIG